jgi:predicted nuclease of predicted toxin-antitoxin system
LKIRADEHVSREIVRAVREMALTPALELTHVIDIGDRGSSDVHWITKFAREGGQAILSADTDFVKRPHQVMAVKETGVRVIHLPSRWANARCDLQAAHILLWWRRIELQLQRMAPRECYRPSWNISEEGVLQKVNIDFQDAEREAARASKASGKTDGAKTSQPVKVEGR